MNRRRASLLSLAVLALTGGLLTLAWRSPRSSGSVRPPEESAPAPALAPLRAGQEPAARAPVAPRASQLDLLACLRALGAVSTTGTADLDAALAPLVSEPATLDLVLAIGVSGGLDERSDPGRLARIGAVRALLAGHALYATAPDPRLPGVRAGDGPARLDALLTSLPAWDAAERDALVLGLAGLSVTTAEGLVRPVLGAAWLERLLVLRAAHPQLADAWARLIRAALTDLPADEREAFGAALLAVDPEPELVELAWTELLSGAQGARHVALAQRALDAPHLGRPHRRALLQAIAQAAPPADAARILGARAGAEHLVPLLTLGERSGGVAALRDEYSALVSADLQADGRRLLVAGMGRASTSELVGIATTDPDARVRGQALVTATLTTLQHEAPGALDAVRTAWRERQDPWLGAAPLQVLMAASNLARLGPATRGGALELLRDIALDPAADDHTRDAALARLERWLPATEHAALVERRAWR